MSGACHALCHAAGKTYCHAAMPRPQRGRELGTVSRRKLLLEHHDERLTDRGIDLAIGASSGAPEDTGHYCTICCTIPDTGGQLAGSLALSSTQRDDVSADRQWDSLRILAK